MLFYYPEGLAVHAFTKNAAPPFQSFIAGSAFEVLADKSGEALMCQTQKGVHKGMRIPERPSGRDVIHSAVRQLLKNVETLISHEDQKIKAKIEDKQRPCPYVGIFPILITNAKLFSACYDNTNVDDNVNLKNQISLKEEPWLVINHSEILRSGTNLQSPVEHLGFYSGDRVGLPSYSGSHMKSIVVVNQQHLVSLLDRWGLQPNPVYEAALKFCSARI